MSKGAHIDRDLQRDLAHIGVHAKQLFKKSQSRSRRKRSLKQIYRLRPLCA